jgi:hypothetical protein
LLLIVVDVAGDFGLEGKIKGYFGVLLSGICSDG